MAIPPLRSSAPVGIWADKGSTICASGPEGGLKIRLGFMKHSSNSETDCIAFDVFWCSVLLIGLFVANI